MYFDAPITANEVVASADVRIVLALNGALVLLLGIFPAGLMAISAQSVLQMLGT